MPGRSSISATAMCIGRKKVAGNRRLLRHLARKVWLGLWGKCGIGIRLLESLKIKGVAGVRVGGTTVAGIGRGNGFRFPILPGSLRQKPVYLPVQALEL